MHRILSALLLAVLVTGCAGAADDSVLEQPSATASTVPSATIVWFPPSATPPPQSLSTQAPTPEQRPGIGTLTLSDDFSAPALWNTAASNEGSASVQDHQLALVAAPGVYIISLRQDLVLGDFYAEMTARPSLCRAQDEYGMLVRASALAYYRLALTCSGMLRLDRVSISSHLILLPAIASGDVPTGAPAEVRLGVWAVGSDLRFFLNGRYQFGLSDRNYRSGTIGAFAHSVADTPVAVTFSDLSVFDVNYSPPTSTPHP